MSPNTAEEMKKSAGYKAVEFVRDGMLVGLGTGTTAKYFIEALALRVKQGLQVAVCASSLASLELAQQGGIPVLENGSIEKLDLYVDGADEIDGTKAMIKGGGGALLREKLLALSAKEMVVIVDESKLVEKLGKFSLAVEIVPFAYRTTVSRIGALGLRGHMRTTKATGEYFKTDNGNFILDIEDLFPLEDPKALHGKLKMVTGVVETGLFFDVASKVVVGCTGGRCKVIP
eukprot:ANDGO_03609.mRNA.1 Ribose-5-phosphate isomerase A